MTQLMTLFKKELLEITRSLKWVWVPLTFVLLAIMDPLTTYYMPQIMESVGGMPEGAVFDIPTPSPEDAIMMSLGQLSSLGVLIITLISMGVIAGERENGITELILVKPVSYLNYILAKWSALMVLTWVSLSAGLLFSWYYVNLLFGSFSFMILVKTVLFYGFWLTLVITLAIFYNTLFKKQGVVAFVTIATIMLFSLITQIFGKFMLWSPINLSHHIHDMLIFDNISSDLIITSLITIVLVGLLLLSSIHLLKTKEIGK